MTQASPLLPPKWNDAVQTLAAKIVSLAGRAKTISLDVKNISSLSAANANAIQQSLEVELARRGLRLAPESSVGNRVTVTFSEGVDGYVWIAQVRGGPDEQTAMVSVAESKVVAANQNREAIVLGKKLVWQQHSKFLDFALVAGPDSASSTLVILEPERFAYYRSSDASGWQFWQGIPIAPSGAWPRELRDLRGSIDNQTGVALLPQIVCTESLDPSRVHCAPEDQKTVFPWRRIKVPGHEDSETMLLSDTCGEDSIALSTANGDWTQPDWVQGYVVGASSEDVHPSGAPIPLEGPVISLERDAKGSGARALVYNLKTSNYEGYFISANCGD